MVAEDGEGRDGSRELRQGRGHGLDRQHPHERVARGHEVAGQEHELRSLGKEPTCDAGHPPGRHLRQGGVDVGEDADA